MWVSVRWWCMGFSFGCVFDGGVSEIDVGESSMVVYES